MTTEPEKPSPSLISIRVKGSEVPPVDGAVPAPCSKCQASVWLAPSAAALGELSLVCMVCARKLPRGGFEPLTDAQRIEIFEETGLYGSNLDRAIEKIQNEIWP